MFEDTDSRFLLAANALYLNRMNFIIEYSRQPREVQLEYRPLDSRDKPSFDRLRSWIGVSGLIDERIEPSFQEFGKFPSNDEELQSLIASNSDVARISFGQVPFSTDERNSIIEANHGRMDRLDWLMPICRWKPCDVIWTAREIVIDRLTAVENEPPSTGTRRGGPRTGHDLVGERKAARALELVERNTSKRPSKQDVIEVITPYAGSKNAANRAWGFAELTLWKGPGAIANDRRMSKEDLRSAFVEHFQN